jgi:hypothetical protein
MNASRAFIAQTEAESLPEAMIALQATSAPAAFVAPEASNVGRLVVEPRAGYTRVPNTVLDAILPTLDPYQQAVYVRLYRLTHGFQRETCKVSFETLAQRSGMSKRQAIRAVERLEVLGLVERASGLRGKKSERGNVYRVPPPLIAESATSASQATSAGQTTSASRARMKDLKESHEKAPDAGASASLLSILRKIAGSYRHTNPHAPDEDVADRLREWFRTEGLEADEAAIDAAIGGAH